MLYSLCVRICKELLKLGICTTILINTKIQALSINHLDLYREKHVKLQRLCLVGSNEKESTEKAEESPKEDIKPVHEEAEYPELSKETEEKAKKNETKLNEDKAGNKTEKVDKEKKAAVVQIKEPISSIETKLGSQMLSSEKFAESQDK